MADKKLKTIQFPGLPDTYTVPQVENGTNNNVAALDGTGNVKDSAIEVSKVAKTDGSYQNLNAGTSDQLNATVGVTDKVPYNFRTAGGSADIGDRLNDKIVGGTIAWNQMSGPVRTGTGQGLTFASEGNGRWHITGTVTTAGNIDITLIPVPTVLGHKYLLSIRTTGSYTGKISFCYVVHFTEGNDSDKIYNCTKEYTDRSYAIFNAKIGDNYDLYITPQVFDLTQMFGATIADYIYSLEQTTAGAGVAWFKNLFPKPYYEYNTGELMSVCTNAHITRGLNAWDEEWAAGYWDINTGLTRLGTNLRCKNKIRVLPNVSYYVKNDPNYSLWILFYDSTGAYLGSNIALRNATFTTPQNAYFLTFYTSTTVPTYNHDICINRSWSGYRNGEYAPYVEHRYPLSPVELRGIPKLDGSNKLYFDGDTYEHDGTVTRKYSAVDLGTLNWTRWAVGQFAVNDVNFIKKPINDNSKYVNFIITNGKYKGQAFNQYSIDKSISVSSSNHLVISDSDYQDTVQFKQAMSGVYLLYELATPTTETANPFADRQIVDDFGTEEYVDALATAETSPRDVEVPVGHETFYQANLRDKLQNLPSNASADGLYLVKQTGNKQELISYTLGNELPVSPAKTGTYVLKLVDGSLTWVLEE